MSPLSATFYAGYAGSLLLFALLGARTVERRGWAGGALLMGALAVAGAAVLGIAGGAHRRALGAGGFSAFATLEASAILAALLAPIALALHAARRRGTAPRRQTAVCVLAAVVVGLLAALPFGLGIWCTLSGECV